MAREGNPEAFNPEECSSALGADIVVQICIIVL
jgi:hypothetical protein